MNRFRHFAVALGGTGFAVAALCVPFATPAHAAGSSYCATLAKIMAAEQDRNPLAGDPKGLKAMASALRSSNAPSEVKQAVADFADGLDKLSGKVKNIKSSTDAKALAKDFGKDSKYQKGLFGILRYERSCASAPSAPAITAAAKGNSAIPDSAKIAAIAKDVPSHKEALPVVQNCNVLATLVLAQDLAKKPNPKIAPWLAKLADTVRPLDPKIADALAKASPQDATSWCKHYDFAN